jgi:hypothetical protein
MSTPIWDRQIAVAGTYQLGRKNPDPQIRGLRRKKGKGGSMKPRGTALVLLAVCAAAVAVGPAAATVLDLYTLGASGTIGDAYFEQVNHQSTGTGVIDPFLRMQANGSEMGVNSDGPYTMDEKSGIWTHAIRVSDFGIYDLNGTPTIRVLLDINETNSAPLLSMDQLKFYTSAVGTYNTVADLNAHGTLVYDMGAGNQVNLDYSLEAGSGAGDMMAYLPYSLFSPHQTEFLYLFSQFGASGGDLSSDDGFEEWTRVDGLAPPPPPPVPEPASLLLLGGGILGLVGIRSLRPRKS